MKVVVLGATGFIGPPLRFALAALGHETVRIARTPGAGVTALDRADTGAVVRAAEGADGVVDLLAMTLAASAPLIAALAGRVDRYVLASSGDVYRQYGALRRKEPLEALLKPIPEDAPLRTVAFPYRGDARRPRGDPQDWTDDYDKIPIARAARGHPGPPA